MNKVLKKGLCTALVVAFFSQNALANENSGSVSVDHFKVWANGSTYITASENLPNPAGCKLGGGKVAAFSKDELDEYAKAVLLTAFANNTPVSLTISGGSCHGNNSKIVAVRLSK